MKVKPVTRIIIYLSFLFSGLLIHSQGPAGGNNFSQNVRYGGGVGLAFGSNSFNIGLSPSAIYDTRKGVALGVGLNFNYAKLGDTKFTAYGGSLLSYFNPLDFLQLSAEYEQLRVNRRFEFPSGTIEEDYWLPALFLGAGYGNRNVVVGIRYDILYDSEKSLYADPWLPFVRVYF